MDRQQRVLVLEDEAVSDPMGGKVRRLGAIPLCARSLLEARRILSEERALALVLLSSRVSDGAGLDLVRDIHRLSSRQPRMLVVARSADPSCARHADRLDVRYLCASDEREVIAAIAEALGRPKPAPSGRGVAIVAAPANHSPWARSAASVIREYGLVVERVRSLRDVTPDRVAPAGAILLSAGWADPADGLAAVERSPSLFVPVRTLLVDDRRSIGSDELARACTCGVAIVSHSTSFFRRCVLRFLDRALLTAPDAGSEPKSIRTARGTAVSVRVSPREREVLEMRVRGRTNEEIAKALGIEACTVKTLVRRARRRLGIGPRDKLELALLAPALR